MRLMNKTEIKIFLTFFIIYSFFIHWGGANENSRLALTRAIVDEGRLTIDSFYNYTGDRSFYQGHYYTDKEPSLSFLAVPVYATWKFIYYNFFPKEFIQFHQAGQYNLKLFLGVKGAYITDPLNPGFFHLMTMILVTIFTSSLFSSFAVVLVYKFVKFWDSNESHRIFATFIAGFATLIFPYGQVFLDHGVATFFAFLAFYLLFKMRMEKRFDNKYLVLAGISSGFAITVSILTAIIAFVCIVYLLLIKKGKLPYFILGGILGVFPFIIYNFLIFDSPFFFSIRFFNTLARGYLDPDIWEIKKGFQSPDPFIFYRITFDSYKGIFFYYPILILSFLGIFYAHKKYRIESLLILILILFYIIANSCEWWWGSYFGPRYLTPISLFLVVPLVFVFQKSSKKMMCLIFLLFIYSTFVNFVGVAPSTDELAEKTRTTIAPEFSNKIKSFEFLTNPIYDYYLPMFLSNGVRSRLFEGLINGVTPDIRFLTPEQREFYYLFYFHVPFLSLLPITLVCVFIWWSEVFTKNRKKIILENRWRILAILFCLILLSSLYVVCSLPEELTHYKGWFPPEKSGERWMGAVGSFLIYNKNSERPMTLSFYTRSYTKDRNIQFYLNDVSVENFTVYTEVSKITTHQMNLKPGLNIFKFISLDGCDIPNILEGIYDDRCLSIGLYNVSLNPIARNQTIILKQNFYLPEKNVSWMRQDGKVLILNLENKTKNVSIQLNLKSFNIDRFMDLILNGQLVNNFAVFKEGTIVNTLVTLKEGENIIALHSTENCTVVDDIERNKDFRCISIGIVDISILSLEKFENRNLTLVFDKGWYLGLGEGNLTSMRNEGSLLIINNNIHPSTKIISIYLKSFIRDREIEIIFNARNIWQLFAFKEGGHINLPLGLQPGINNLEFLSDTCDFPSDPEDKRCISLSVGGIEIKDVDTSGIFVLPFTDWYDKELQEEERWMRQDGEILIFNFENEVKDVKIKFDLKSLYTDKSVTLYSNNQPIDNFMVFKESSTLYTPLITLKEGENIITLHSTENCTVVDDIERNKDFRCISIGITNISVLTEDEIKNQNLTFIFNKNWYDKEPQEEERWMNNNATISIFNFENRAKNVTFYFDLVPFYEKKTIHFFLNDEEENTFDISLDGGEVYTEQLSIFPGENILRFYSDEKCLEIAKIEKSNDYRCVTIGLRSIKFKTEG